MAGTSDANALVLKLSADNSQILKTLDQLNKRLDTLAPEWEKKGKKAAHALENSFKGEGFGKALDKVFDSSRLAVLEEGSAKIRIFGSALEPLGPLGLTAAAGIAAFALTMERTEKAVEFAASIAKVGNEVGVTTDFIQKFNFAAGQSDVDVGKADEALKGLNTSLGLVQSGLAKKNLVNAFAALGFTPDQLRQFHDVGDLFPVLADRISKTGNAAEQAAIAKRLGIEDLIPLLKEGENGFNALAKKAEDLGIVMDHSVIEKAKEADDKLRALDDVMKAKSAVTFAEFADTLITVKTAFLGAETAALRFLAAITGTTPAKERLKDLSEQITTMVANGAALEPAGRVALAHRVAEVHSILSTLPKGGEETPGASAAAKALVDTTPKASHAAAPHDETANFDKSASDAYDSGLKALLAAQAALTDGIKTRAALEKSAIDAELSKKTTDLDAQEAKIREAAKKGLDANAQKQIAALEAAKTEEQNAAQAKKELVDRQTIVAVLDQQATEARAAADFRASGLDAEAQHFNALADLALTTEDRNAFERKALAAAQERERVLADAQADQALATLAAATASGKTADIINASNAVMAAFQAQANVGQTQADQRAALGRAQENPIQKFQDEVQNFSTTAQEAGVSAMKNLSTGLADAIVNAKSLGDVGKSVFRQLVADLLAAAIQKDVAAPLMALIPGFASGTPSAPGGLALVGEKGPELVNLPKGASVTPTNQTMSALKNMRTPTAPSATIVQQSLLFDLRGGVTTDDLLRQMNAMTVQAKNQAIAQSLKLGKQQLPDALRAHQQLRG